MSQLDLSFESKEDSLSVRTFSVREAISTPFTASIIARSPNDAIDLESIVGRPAGFLMMGGFLSEPRVWSGICTHFDQIQAETKGLSTYSLRIAPTLWLTTRRRGNRIFEHMTVIEIVQKILSEHAIEPELRIRDPHEKHEYRVQYGETDFAFISRLLEEEGIAYTFEQVAEGNAYKTKLVIADKPESSPVRPGGPIGYVDNPNQAARMQFVTNVRVSRRVRAGAFTIRDYDFVKPGRKLEGKAKPEKAPEDFYEQYHFAPSAFIKDRDGKPRDVKDDEAERRATIALAAKRSDQREVMFRTNAYDLAPGVVFGIDGHPRKELAPEEHLLITECFTDGSADGEWSADLRSVFTSVRFRPQQRTQKPVMVSQQSAIVVGQKGEEIHTDEHGRVRVQFHWDRDGKYDEKSSCWVRVSQGWAGAAWGQIMLPRVGHEVLVDFFEGDPDQPVIVGRVFNARTKVPYKLPDEKTRSTWKSDSSPHSNGFNEIMFEDKASRELVYIQGQRNLSKLVKKDETERTGTDKLTIVGKTRSSVTGAVDSTLVGEKHLLATVSPTDLKILALDNPSYSLQTTAMETVDQKITLTTTKATQLLDGANITLTADTGIKMQSGGDITINGNHVYINTQSVASQKLKAEADLADHAARPRGRMLGAIKDAFSKTEAAPEDEGGAGEQKVERKDLAVPHRIQVGGTCGIAALGMVLDYWNAQDGTQKNPSDKDMLALAQKNGWSKTGETSPKVRADLAKTYGYEASYKYKATVDDLKKAIADGVPPIIAFNVDQSAGNPQATDLNRAHAAVIKGFFTKDGKEYIVATHGWGNAKTKEWPLDEFEKSWSTRDRSMNLVKPKAKP